MEGERVGHQLIAPRTLQMARRNEEYLARPGALSNMSQPIQYFDMFLTQLIFI
jgi:hypothetical protein